MFVLNYCHGGFDGDIVSVEADLRMGIPGIDIVGMPILRSASTETMSPSNPP